MTGDEVAAIISQAAAQSPRSQQAEIGPSEAGDPCSRKLAFKILSWRTTGRDLDPWASVQGTAIHAWMAAVFAAENTRLGRERYLIEHRVQPASEAEARRIGLPPGHLAGSADLFDRDTGKVTDWKLSSESRIAHYREHGPGPLYRGQAHLYGAGMANAGEQVKEVSICFLPRATFLTGLHIWSEPYDPAVARAVIERVAAIRAAVIALDPEMNPGRWAFLPTAQSCRFCPYLKAGSRRIASGCPGHTGAADLAAADPLTA